RACTRSWAGTIPTRHGSRRSAGRARWRCAPRRTDRCPSAASPSRRGSRPGTWPSTATWSSTRVRNECRRRPAPAAARTAGDTAPRPATGRTPVLVDAAVDVAGVGADVLLDGRLAGDEDRPGRGRVEPGAADRLPRGQPLPPQGRGRRIHYRP